MTIDYQSEAFRLYKLTDDPLTLDAVRVLANPEHPMYEMAREMVERMLDAERTLFPPK